MKKVKQYLVQNLVQLFFFWKMVDSRWELDTCRGMNSDGSIVSNPICSPSSHKFAPVIFKIFVFLGSYWNGRAKMTMMMRPSLQLVYIIYMWLLQTHSVLSKWELPRRFYHLKTHHFFPFQRIFIYLLVIAFAKFAFVGNKPNQWLQNTII